MISVEKEKKLVYQFINQVSRRCKEKDEIEKLDEMRREVMNLKIDTMKLVI